MKRFSPSTHATEGDDEKRPLLKPTTGYLEVSYEENEFFYNSITSVGSINQEEEGEHHLTRSTYSMQSQASVIATLAEKLSGDRESSLFLTICNILPILQGSAVLGIPFAVVTGGLAFVPAGILLCVLADITGLLLVECLYSVSPSSKRRKRVHTDLVDVGYTCWGKHGARFINIVNMFYLTANNVVCVVLLGECLYDIIGAHTTLGLKEITSIFSVLLLPPLFIRKLSVLAYISMAGVASVLIACLVAVIIFIKHSSNWSVNVHQIPTFDINGFPLALAILLYTNLLNSILPNIEGVMRDPTQVKTALHVSYGISTIFKVSFGLLGALTYGVTTKQLVAMNVSDNSVIAKYILNLVLCIYAISNFSLMYFVVFEQIDRFMREKFLAFSSAGKLYVPWLLVSRVLGVLLCLVIALVVPYFALVSGVVGGFIGTLLVFIFPITFHLQLKWKEISNIRRASEVLLLIVGICVGSLATYTSVVSLALAIKNGK